MVLWSNKLCTSNIKNILQLQNSSNILENIIHIFVNIQTNKRIDSKDAARVLTSGVYPQTGFPSIQIRFASEEVLSFTSSMFS